LAVRAAVILASALLALVAGGAYLAMPPALVNEATAPTLPADLDGWIAARERSVAGVTPLVAGTDKRLLWRDGRRRTRYSVVYLHGFSATRREIAPVPERVAAALGANLFETRLAGHGRVLDPLAGVSAEDWLDDAAEALAIGAAIGDDVIVIGTSTGATLAAAMASDETFGPVSLLVMISPNFGPRDDNARWLTRPAGPLLVRLMYGETRTWQPHNELQARYWSTTYPYSAAVEMMRLVDHVEAELPLAIDADLLVFLSPADSVVSADAIVTAVAAIDAPRKRTVEMVQPGDPSNHVLAGDILSPSTTDRVVADIVNFVTAP